MSPIIEGLRGLGALMVVVHHYVYSLSPAMAEALAGLHFFHAGVDLFFVLTGYLFAPLVLGIRHQSARVFIKRRVWRLYPLYLLSLALTVIFVPSSTLESWFENLALTLWQFLQHLFFLQAAPWQNLHGIAYFNEVYWTLSVEVAFYALVLVCLFLPATLSPKLRFWGLALVSSVGFLIMHYWHYQPSNGNWLVRQAQLPTLLIEFWLGIAVFYWFYNKPESSFSYNKYIITKTWLILFLSTVFLIILYFIYPLVSVGLISPRPFGWFNLGVAFSFALLLAGLLLLDKQKALHSVIKKPFKIGLKIIIHKTVLHLGSLSYGVYLLHSLVLLLLSGVFESPNLHLLASVLVTWLLAALLYRWFELPCRNYGRRPKKANF